jgi:hypothetical protein
MPAALCWLRNEMTLTMPLRAVLRVLDVHHAAMQWVKQHSWEAVAGVYFKVTHGDAAVAALRCVWCAALRRCCC